MWYKKLIYHIKCLMQKLSETKAGLRQLSLFALKKSCNFLSLVGGLFFLCIIVFVYGIMYFSNDIPDYSSLQNYNPPTITRLYSPDLELLTEYAYEPRIFTKISNIPKLLINAFIAAEDKTFFENYGIDPIGIVRSAAKSISNLSAGKRAIGGSTITQQVVQSFIIGKKRTLDRKIAEAILAYRISVAFSKENILELYLNQIFLGNNSYGVEAAAKTYFNKELMQLNISEVAILASLPKAPSSLSPYVNPTKLLDRRNWVIRRMYEEDMIGADDMIEYSKMDLNVVPKRQSQTASADFFYSEEVKKQLIQFYGEQAVYTKGLTVNTNIDARIQERSIKALQYGIEAYDKRHGWRGPLGKISIDSNWKEKLNKFIDDFTKKNGQIAEKFKICTVLEVTNKCVKIGLPYYSNNEVTIPTKNLQWARQKLKNNSLGKTPQSPKNILNKGDVIVASFAPNDENTMTLEQIPDVNGAIVVIENYTGKVLGLVGGYNPNSTYFNRVTQAQRQPGSAFKTLIYLTAVENGFSKDSILVDEPMAISQGKGMPNWRPQNFTNKFNGAVTLQEAFTRSLNIPAIQTGVILGLEKIYGTASKLGVYPRPKNELIPCKNDEIAKKYCTNYSLLLGAFETTLLNLTTAYATIASSGYAIHPSLINSIYDSNGDLLYKHDEMSLFHSKDENDMPNIKTFRQKLIKTNANNKIIEILKNAVSNQSRDLKVTVAGKTGTTNNSYDTWFIGSSKDFTVGIFIGFDLPTNMGKKEIGATVARPVFMHFMKSMLQDIKDGDVSQPPIAIEFINTNDSIDDAVVVEEDLELISEILKKSAEIKIDPEDAYSARDDLKEDEEENSE